MSLKKLTVLFLSTIIGLSLAACGSGKTTDQTANTEKDVVKTEDTDNKYGEHLEFTVLSLDYPEGFDTMPLIVEAKEKFNIDFKVQQVAWDNWDETTRTLAASGSLPEVVAWYNVIYGEYKSYAEQGVLKPLPSDLSRWPRLQKYADLMPVMEKLTLDDGNLYCFPKYNPNQPFNTHRNELYLYRRDWAEAMGYDFAPVQELTYDELVSYLQDLKTQDPGGLGDKLVPLDFYNGGQDWSIAVGQFNKYFSSYYLKDGEYVWGGRDESTLEGIKALKALYDDGILFADSYTDGVGAGNARFCAGRSGVVYGAYSTSHIIEGLADPMKADIEGFEDEDLGVFLVTMPDGTIHSAEFDSWWGAFAFSTSCSDEVMERFMDMADWMLEEEQIEKAAYGVPGEDWTKDENGNVILNWTAEDTAGGDKEYIVEQRLFQKWFVLEGLDKWLEGNPAKRTYLMDDVYKAYFEQLQEAEEEGRVTFYPIDFNVAYASTPSYDLYGGFNNDVLNAIIEAVVSKDAEASWNEFLDGNESKIDAVLSELNEALLGK